MNNLPVNTRDQFFLTGPYKIAKHKTHVFKNIFFIFQTQHRKQRFSSALHFKVLISIYTCILMLFWFEKKILSCRTHIENTCIIMYMYFSLFPRNTKQEFILTFQEQTSRSMKTFLVVLARLVHSKHTPPPILNFHAWNQLHLPLKKIILVNLRIHASRNKTAIASHSMPIIAVGFRIEYSPNIFQKSRKEEK